jgi:hypothetical protein
VHSTYHCKNACSQLESPLQAHAGQEVWKKQSSPEPQDPATLLYRDVKKFALSGPFIFLILPFSHQL